MSCFFFYVGQHLFVQQVTNLKVTVLHVPRQKDLIVCWFHHVPDAKP